MDSLPYQKSATIRSWKSSNFEPQPFIRKALADSDPDLCSTCQAIDFERILSLRNVASDGLPVFPFSLGTARERQRACKMCSLFVSIAEPLATTQLSRRNEDWHLRVYDAAKINALYDSSRQAHSRFFNNVLVLLPTRPTTTVKERSVFELGQQFRIPGESVVELRQQFRTMLANFMLTLGPENQTGSMNELPCFLQAKELEPLISDYSFAIDCIGDCLETHFDCSRAGQSPNVPIKVIDCLNRTIVPHIRGQNYVALSYVWGNSKRLSAEESAKLEQSAALPTRCPTTVEHALQAVLGIKERYLWVDQYCINQYHAKAKSQQIAAMGEIYKCALITIVALGTHSEAGLPGIARSEGRCASKIQVRQMELHRVKPSVQSCFDSSVWSDRAWTYQEALLSPRCLVFTEYQLCVICRQQTRMEGFQQPPLDPRHGKPQWSEDIFNPRMMMPIFEPRSGAVIEPTTLQTHLLEYHRRNMTYESDALNAFRGILAQSGHRSYWGIPITIGCKIGGHGQRNDMPSCSLVHWLIWEFRPGTGSGSLQRRTDFPTWSWASTANSIQFNLATRAGKVTRKVGTLCKHDLYPYHARVLVFDQPWGGMLDFDDFANRYSSPLLPEYDRRLLISAPVAKCLIKPAFGSWETGRHLDYQRITFLGDFGFLHENGTRKSLFVRATLDYETRSSEDFVTNHGLLECEAVLLLVKRSTSDEWFTKWMIIDTRDDHYVRIGMTKPYVFDRMRYEKLMAHIPRTIELR